MARVLGPQKRQQEGPEKNHLHILTIEFSTSGFLKLMPVCGDSCQVTDESRDNFVGKLRIKLKVFHMAEILWLFEL